MYTCMFQNSYVVMFITFTFLCLFFYLFEIGFNKSVQTDATTGEKRTIKKFSWKYPLAIALIVWLVWHFYLYPPAEIVAQPSSTVSDYSPTNQPIAAKRMPYMTNEATMQKINMNNWN